MDIGCGNGYTLEILSKRFKDQNFVGIEKNDKLRKIAESRFNSSNIQINSGDIRDKDFTEDDSVDILISQRVLINLMDKQDQALALQNIINKIKLGNSFSSNGKLLFIEAFKSPLENLNRARTEFGLKEISEAKHNLYLDDNFFNPANIMPFISESNIPTNFLSTHYFVTRVLHDIFISNQKSSLIRNSEFVKFFSCALNPYIGDYSPIKFFTFERK
jgi:SAM-dependent methyltransferase